MAGQGAGFMTYWDVVGKLCSPDSWEKSGGQNMSDGNAASGLVSLAALGSDGGALCYPHTRLHPPRLSVPRRRWDLGNRRVDIMCNNKTSSSSWHLRQVCPPRIEHEHPHPVPLGMSSGSGHEPHHQKPTTYWVSHTHPPIVTPPPQTTVPFLTALPSTALVRGDISKVR